VHNQIVKTALDTLYAHGVTERYALMATTAAHRLGFTPSVVQLDRTSFHVEGRYHRGEDPDAHGIPITQGSSRAPRPDLQHVRLDLIVAHPAGIPMLMTPRSGHTSDASDVGPVVTHPMPHLPTAHGVADLVADSALDRAEHLQPFTPTSRTWITRVPATVTAAHDALAQADPQAMLPLMAG
jgi:transposase